MQIHGVVRSILSTKHEASGGCHERSEEGASRRALGRNSAAGGIDNDSSRERPARKVRLRSPHV